MENFFKKPIFIGIFFFTILFQACNGKHDPNGFTELKVNHKLQRLTEEQTLKIMVYRRSICNVAEFFKEDFTTSCASHTFEPESNCSNAGDIKTIKSYAQMFYEITKLRELAKFVSQGSIRIEDINSISEFSSFLEKIDKDWDTADVYSYENHEGIYSINLRFTKTSIECITELQERLAEPKIQQ